MVSWTNEERNAIIKEYVAKANLTTDDFKKLHEEMPDRTVNQIKDQYVKFLKPYILGLFSESPSSAAGSSSPSTPSSPSKSTPKKRIRARNTSEED